MLFLRGQMSERRLLGLIKNLPPESALMRAMSDTDPGVQWSQTDYLLASVVDALQALSWITFQVAGKQYDDNPMGEDPPEPIYRPVRPPEPVIPVTPLADMGAWLAQIGQVPNAG